MKRLNEQRSEFLGIAVHDLKNPLTAISAIAEMLLVDTKEAGAAADSEQVEMLGQLARSAVHMRDIVTDLLASEAIDSGRIELQRRTEDLADLAGIVCEMNQARAETKNIRLVLDAKPGYCLANVDGRRMREVMDNLVSNAVKFSPQHRTVWVTVRSSDESPGVVLFSVRDEGPGLTEQDKQKLFGRFVKLSARPTGDESSTGLGLSIVKRLVELHDGRIRVDSEHGHGATFTVQLPAGAGRGGSGV
jgi:signal transduction histidine kinase